MKDKLSSRILSIVKLVPPHIEVIWDLCCDHGKIGQYFLPKKTVHFLDQILHITENLQTVLLDSDIPSAAYSIICKDVSKFDFEKTDKKRCFIFVGVGADLITKTLSNFHFTKNDYFIISAHQNSYKVRSYLRENKINILEEILVDEAGQHYEILLIHKFLGKYPNLVGAFDWEKHQEYLRKQLGLFKIKSENDARFLEIYEEYLKIKKF